MVILGPTTPARGGVTVLMPGLVSNSCAASGAQRAKQINTAPKGANRFTNTHTVKAWPGHHRDPARYVRIWPKTMV